jgi:thiamine-monophosphate kinase
MVPSSEFDLIARLVERLPPPSPRLRVASGDDAAVVEPAPGPEAVTVDAVVEGVHFTRPEFSPEAIGRKALATALSDLAAMGAEPGEAYVVLGASPEEDEAVLLGIADGMAEVALRDGISIAGGDFVRAPQLLLSVTCVGYEQSGVPLVTRSGAQVGDVVAVTGHLGGGAAALKLLQGFEPTGLATVAVERLLAYQLDPRPRLAEGRALAASGATAMIDISDGLGADAAHLAEASGVSLSIELQTLPLAEGIAAVLGGSRAAERVAASGGEDYELLVTIPPERLDSASEAVRAAGSRLSEIGQVMEGSGATVMDSQGRKIEASGFDHIRGSRAGSA